MIRCWSGRSLRVFKGLQCYADHISRRCCAVRKMVSWEAPKFRRGRPDRRLQTEQSNGPAKRHRARAAAHPFRQRRRRPGGSSRAARNRLRSGPGNRRRRSRDCACHILLVRRSLELIKTFGTRCLKQVMQGQGSQYRGSTARQIGAAPPPRDQARDRTPSKAWAMKIPAPTRPITAVNISNIANILCAPHEANDAQARTVKRISTTRRTIDRNWGFHATDVPKAAN